MAIGMKKRQMTWEKVDEEEFDSRGYWEKSRRELDELGERVNEMIATDDGCVVVKEKSEESYYTMNTEDGLVREYEDWKVLMEDFEGTVSDEVEK
jgi:hypothetical protein